MSAPASPPDIAIVNATILPMGGRPKIENGFADYPGQRHHGGGPRRHG